MKNIKFTFLIKVLLGNLANDYELGSGGFENQTTSNIQENQIGRSRILVRKNTNPTYRFSPEGISKGVFNRSSTPRPPAAGSVPGPTNTCNNVDLSAHSLFEDSSPCRLNCKRANIRCDICKKRRGRQKEICLSYHRKKLVICERCMKNPHGLTQAEIERITTLNNLKFNEDLVGETASSAPDLGSPKIKFTLHDIDGNLLKDQSGLDPRVLFGWTAKSKQIPWQIQFLNPHFDQYQCGGTLITPNKIVSAAHCFYDEWLSDAWRKEDLVIKAGNIERMGRSDFVQKRKCSQIIVHS